MFIQSLIYKFLTEKKTLFFRPHRPSRNRGLFSRPTALDGKAIYVRECPDMKMVQICSSHSPHFDYANYQARCIARLLPWACQAIPIYGNCVTMPHMGISVLV
jgi:hypothetical protein